MDYIDERRHLPLINKNKLLVCGHVFKDDDERTLRIKDNLTQPLKYNRKCLKCDKPFKTDYINIWSCSEKCNNSNGFIDASMVS